MFTCILTITPPYHNSTELFKAGRCKIDAYCASVSMCIRDSLLFALLAYLRHKLHSDRIDSARPRPCQIIQFRSHYLREKHWRSVHSLTQTLTQIKTAAHFLSANTNTVMHTQTRAQITEKGLFYLFMFMIHISQWRLWHWLHNAWTCRRSDAWRWKRVLPEDERSEGADWYLWVILLIMHR